MKVTRRPTLKEIEATVRTIETMKFFPLQPSVKFELSDLLASMVATPEDLEWFRCLLRDRVSEWPGLAELRAIYCTSRKPFDGNEGTGYSTLPGFQPGDIEGEKVKPSLDAPRVGRGEPLRQIAASMLELPPADAPIDWVDPGAGKPKALPDPEAETRRAKIADEFERLRAEKIRNAMADMSSDDVKQ